jgi:hypothetical protein
MKRGSDLRWGFPKQRVGERLTGGRRWRVPCGGEREEGRAGLDWFGLVLGPGHGPSWAAVLFSIFFLLFSFSFVSDFCFGFLKKS